MTTPSLPPGTLVLCAAVVLPGLALAQQSERFKTYADNWGKAQEAFAAKRYRAALDHYARVAAVLPYEPSCRYQIACCHARLDEPEKALDALAAAVRFGWDDPAELERAEDLNTLRDHPRFAGVVADARACRDEEIVLYAGKNVDPKRPTPLLVLLHGLGGGPRTEVPYWHATADAQGLVIAAPRGPTRVGARTSFGWHREGAKNSADFDAAAAGKRVDAAVRMAKATYTIDDDRVVLAGFSQGGGIALKMLGDFPERYRGAIAVCTLYEAKGAAHWRAAAAKRPVRAYVMAGKLDKLVPRSRLAVEELRAGGVPTEHVEFDAVGHEPPLDYAVEQRRAIDFVLSGAK
jgi:predicted esterase